MQDSLKIEDLIKLKKIINIKALCEAANLKPGTIAAKISKKTELLATESDNIVSALAEFRLLYKK
jgi:hypothetical protein